MKTLVSVSALVLRLVAPSARLSSAVALIWFCAVPAHATSVSVDAVSEGPVTQYLNPMPPSLELDVIGVYTTASGSHPTGNPVVSVKYNQATPMKPITLVLSSYEANVWQLQIDPLAKVDKIVLNGNYPQSVTGAGSIPIVNYSDSGPRLTIGVGGPPHRWPLSNGGSNTAGFVAGLENAFGARLGSFTGVYSASQFTVTGSPLTPATVNPIVGAGNLTDGVNPDLIYNKVTGEVKMNLDDLVPLYSNFPSFHLENDLLLVHLANHDGSFNVAQSQSEISQLSFHDIALNANRVGLDYVDLGSWHLGQNMSFGNLLPPGIPDAAALRNYFAAAGYGNSSRVGDFDLFVVPEPGSFAMLAIGAIGIYFCRKRRQSESPN
jgi:hypothetical protein